MTKPPARRFAFIHTVTGLPAPFAALAEELLPDAEVHHVVDESLLTETIRHGLVPATVRRLTSYVVGAAEVGVDAVLVTCSSVGPAVETVRRLVDIPVLRVDEPMAAEAVRLGGRIGVLATLDSTLTPTASLVRRAAEDAGRDVTVLTERCAGAFEALQNGDRDAHDRRVGAAASAMAEQVDVLVLAQASMARVLEALEPGRLGTAVLSSPRSGVLQLADLARG